MGLPPALMQALFIYNLLKMSVPFTRHRYWLYPLIFLVLAVPCLFLFVFGCFGIADGETRLAVHGADRHHLRSGQNSSADAHISRPSSTSAVVHVPKNFEMLCMANVTMTSLTMMALFFMLAWIAYQAERGWTVYVQPLLIDMMMFEKTIWAAAPDLRGVVPPEALGG